MDYPNNMSDLPITVYEDFCARRMDYLQHFKCNPLPPPNGSTANLENLNRGIAALMEQDVALMRQLISLTKTVAELKTLATPSLGTPTSDRVFPLRAKRSISSLSLYSCDEQNGLTFADHLIKAPHHLAGAPDQPPDKSFYYVRNNVENWNTRSDSTSVGDNSVPNTELPATPLDNFINSSKLSVVEEASPMLTSTPVPGNAFPFTSLDISTHIPSHQQDPTHNSPPSSVSLRKKPSKDKFASQPSVNSVLETTTLRRSKDRSSTLTVAGETAHKGARRLSMFVQSVVETITTPTVGGRSRRFSSASRGRSSTLEPPKLKTDIASTCEVNAFTATNRNRRRFSSYQNCERLELESWESPVTGPASPRRAGNIRQTLRNQLNRVSGRSRNSLLLACGRSQGDFEDIDEAYQVKQPGSNDSKTVPLRYQESAALSNNDPSHHTSKVTTSNGDFTMDTNCRSAVPTSTYNRDANKQPAPENHTSQHRHTATNSIPSQQNRNEKDNGKSKNNNTPNPAALKNRVMKPGVTKKFATVAGTSPTRNKPTGSARSNSTIVHPHLLHEGQAWNYEFQKPDTDRPADISPTVALKDFLQQATRTNVKN